MRRAIGVFRKTARCLAGIVALAGIGLSLPGVVKAQDYTGTLWAGTSAASDATVAAAASQSTSNYVTFSLTNINFNLGSPQVNANVGTFLASNPSLSNIVYHGTITSTTAFTTVGNLVTGGYVLITGTLGLNAGATSVSVSHDDGAELQVVGATPSTVFSNPGPQSDDVDTHNVNVATTGDYVFNLAYGEVNGTPAILQTTLPAQFVPEPSTLAIAGLGALGFGAYHYRRRRAGKA
jgi:hypothetical protein